MHHFESFHDKLVRTSDEVEIVCMDELLRDVATEQEASTPRGQPPALNVIGIRPQKIAHRSVVWHFLLPVDVPDLIDRVDIWTDGRREGRRRRSALLKRNEREERYSLLPP